MIVEIFIVCLTIYALLSPIVWAKAAEIRERTHRLEIENEQADWDAMNVGHE